MLKKLQNLRSKTESEKHFIAVAGAGVLTFAITAAWVYGTFSHLGSLTLPKAEAEISTEEFSPIAQFTGIITGSFKEITEDVGTALSNASVLFTSREYEASTTETQ